MERGRKPGAKTALRPKESSNKGSAGGDRSLRIKRWPGASRASDYGKGRLLSAGCPPKASTTSDAGERRDTTLAKAQVTRRTSPSLGGRATTPSKDDGQQRPSGANHDEALALGSDAPPAGGPELRPAEEHRAQPPPPPPPPPPADPSISADKGGQQVEEAGKFVTAKRSDEDVLKPSGDERQALMLWDEMPQHLQFNPHIHTGYRPLMTPAECLVSIFRLHNETVNILTHGFAIVYILVTVPFILPWGSRGAFSGFLSWCHLLGAVSPWIGSFIYHVFMNLEYGENFYRSLLKLDMLGIWICQSFGAMPLIAASIHCLPDILWHLCVSTYFFLSIWGLFKAMNASSPWERRLCFSPLFLMRMLVVGFRSFGLGGGNPEAFIHIVLQDLVAVVGGTIGAMRIPEKWMPGRLDLLFNSHNIMHVMVVLAVCSMHTATLQDLAWMSEPNVCSRPADVPLTVRHEEL